VSPFRHAMRLVDRDQRQRHELRRLRKPSPDARSGAT
jgi:hypothetical protein